MNVIEIWAPRFKDKWAPKGQPVVLPAVHKVNRGTNYIRITKSKAYNGLYSFDGSRVIDKCHINSNGAIDCYVVPVSWLVPVEEEKGRSKTPAKAKEENAPDEQMTWEDMK